MLHHELYQYLDGGIVGNGDGKLNVFFEEGEKGKDGKKGCDECWHCGKRDYLRRGCSKFAGGKAGGSVGASGGGNYGINRQR